MCSPFGLKIIFFVLNLILSLGGKYLIYYGVTMLLDSRVFFHNYYSDLQFLITCLPYVTMVLGICTTLIGYFGCCDCKTKTVTSLKSYAHCLETITIFKVVFVIILYTQLVNNAARTFVRENWPIFSITQTLNFLDEMLSPLRIYLICFIVLEIIITMFTWYFVPIKVKILLQESIIVVNQPVPVAVPTPMDMGYPVHNGMPGPMHPPMQPPMQPPMPYPSHMHMPAYAPMGPPMGGQGQMPYEPSKPYNY